MNFIDDAYERLTKTAPDLIRYISTFVDLSNEVPENYGVELGIFMLLSGQSIFYVPVVAKGGTVYPIDSVFSTEDNQFFPLTPKFVDKVINSNETNLGKKTTIPGNVIKNPNVRELIEPPKTGKFAYASASLTTEFLYQLSEPSKKAFLEKIASDATFGKGLHKLGFDLEEIKEVLAKPIEKQASYRPVELGLRIVTGGSSLPNTVVQEILQRGYGIVGYNTNPTFAVEYDAKNDGYTKLSAAQTGQAYEVVMKDGSTKVGFVPPLAGSLQETGDQFHSNERIHKATVIGSVKDGANKTANKNPIIVFEDGTYTNVSSEPVTRATTLGKMDDILLELSATGSFKKIDEVDGYNYPTYMLITKNGWMGPFSVRRPPTRNETGATLEVRAVDGDIATIHQSPNVHGDISIVGRDIYVNDNAVFFHLGTCINEDVETDTGVASIKRSHMFTNLLAPVRIGHDGVEFSINGRAVGQEADLARELMERKGLSKQAFDQFAGKAREQHSVTIYMSKQAAMGAGPDYQSTPPNMPGSQMTPPSDNEPAVPSVARGYSDPQNGYNSSFQTIQGAMGTGDKSIVESTIISEFINDPNMMETIGTYLPVIKEAVDKLGRSIFLVRLNINNLSASIEPEYLSNLMSSLRNTYKMLGDTFMRLDSLTNTSMVEEGEL